MARRLGIGGAGRSTGRRASGKLESGAGRRQFPAVGSRTPGPPSPPRPFSLEGCYEMGTRRWLRLDVGWDDSDWIIDLPPGAQLTWIKLLTYAKACGTNGRVRAMTAKAAASRWRIPQPDVDACLTAAVLDGAVVVEDGDWVLTGWIRYQATDPTAAERVKRYRADKSRLSPLRVNTVTHRNVTPVLSRATETETETETENPPICPPEGDQPKKVRKRATALSGEWRPTDSHLELAGRLGVDMEAEADQFRDHHAARGSTFLDWGRAFNTWLRNAQKFHPGGNGKAREDVEQTVADVLLMVGDHASDLSYRPRPEALGIIAAAHPIHWQRSGRWMENLRLGALAEMAARDREKELRLQLRQLNGVVAHA